MSQLQKAVGLSDVAIKGPSKRQHSSRFRGHQQHEIQKLPAFKGTRRHMMGEAGGCACHAAHT
jgi:hypothetical protein